MGKIHMTDEYAFLSGSKAAVFLSDTEEMVGDSKTPTEAIKHKAKDVKFVLRGKSNKLPTEVMEKVYANVTVGANIEFNSKMAYGDGILVVRKIKDETSGQVKFVEVLDSEEPEIFKFLENNNYINSIQEWANDLVVFYDSYVEFIFSKEGSKIASLLPIESINSRVSEADEKSGKIEYHGYSTLWHEGTPDAEKVAVSPLLDRRIPILDLKRRRGLELNLNGKMIVEKEDRYVLQLMLPTPGRYYYGKPYWWSIFSSKWYDFSCAIPKFKEALLKNQMTLKYHVKINVKFWEKLYNAEKITDENKKKARKLQFLTNMDDFLSGAENAGKSFVSHFEYDRIKGFEEQDISITHIESFLKGGEYIEDSEEVTNILCYAMGVHPSIVGATPGKGKSINGTEARELFIIKQALMKPVRDMFLLPLYITKAINGWNPDVHFVIPNIMLTTLDKNTGAEKSIGNQKI